MGPATDLESKGGRRAGEPNGEPRRCPECGVVAKPGDKRCSFCWRKFPSAEAGAHQGLARRRPALTSPRSLAKTAVVLCLLAGVLLLLRARSGDRNPSPPPTPPPPLSQGQGPAQQAYRVCEEYLRRHPPLTFSVNSVSSARVAVEKNGYLVSGTVELHDPTGASVRKRFSCTVLPDGKSGLTVTAEKIE